MISYRGAFIVCLVTLVVGVGALAGTASAQSQVTLTITVVDQDGNRLSNVDVSATWDDGNGGPVNETTRANGQALVDVPEGAEVSIDIHDDEYVRNQPLVVENASSREVEVDVSESATATVSAVDGDGQPIDTPRVRLYRDGNYVVDRRAGSDGTLTTKPIETGTYSVIVTKAGFYRNLTKVDVSGQTETTVRIEEGSVLVKVSVADDHFDDPKPIRNATVQIESNSGFSGSVPTLSDGTASVSAPVNDRYDLTVTKDGYETVEQRVSVGESETSANVTIQRTPKINLTSANRRVVVGETVRLLLVDEYGDTVANATVTRNGTEVGMTDADGEITVEVPESGNVSFTATAGDLSSTVTVEGIEPGQGGTGTATQTATPSDTSDGTETTSVGGPGFTVGITLVALLALTALAGRRR